VRFSYEYRTGDNVRHTGVVVASGREAAFQALKAKGIRPGKLTEAPGFFNKLFGKGKRWLAIAVLGVLCVVLCMAALRLSREAETGSAALFDDTTRRQVIGDSAVIEYGLHTGWADVFAHEGERFLASFAIPGAEAAVRNTSEGEIRAALSRKVGVEPGDGVEARQVKSMVEGVKDELRRFLSKGGTVVEYGQRLVERQERERAYYRMACDDVRNAVATGATERAVFALWKARNDALRRMGVCLVPIPETMLEEQDERDE